MAASRPAKFQNRAEKTEPFSSSPPPPPSPASTLSQALASTSQLAHLLPTGTLLAFQLLTPAFTRNGSCDPTARLMTVALLLLLAASAVLSCFTDSLRLPDGRRVFGLATPRGLWLFEAAEAPKEELAGFRLRSIDFVHAALSALVFGAVALRDGNVAACLYPAPGRSAEEVLDVLPLGIGVLCSFLFLVFPTTRRGVGHPVSASLSS